jgi:hypothetical protein
MPIRTILVLVITAFSPVCAQKPQTFSDPEGRFTVQVPSGWRAVPLTPIAFKSATAALI